MKLKSTLSYFPLILVLCVGWFENVQALPSKDDISLIEAIERISKEYEVYFTFDMTLVADVRVDYEYTSYQNAEEAISTILRGTELKYKFYDERFVILYKENAEGLESLRKMSQHLDGLISEGERSINTSPKQEVRTVPILTRTNLPKTLVPVSFSVEGSVVDQQGEPLIGVNIQIKGTNHGTATDLEGKFVFEEIDDNAVLVVSYIGYQTLEVPVSGKSTLTITLISDSQLLDEVVVVGYGTQKKNHMTGAVGSIQMDEAMNGLPVSDFGQAIYGQVAGVQIQNASGRPGESSRLQIRGINTISSGAEPLLVIDGVPMPSYDLSIISTSDIKSIDVLKDAASASIYGSRGANGVVLITTKQGVSGVSRLTLDYNFTYQSQMRYLDMMNSVQYAQAAIDNAQNAWIDKGGDPNTPNTIEARGDIKYTWPKELENPEFLPNTNWQELMTRTAPMHNVRLSYSGGSVNSTYRISGSALNQEGIYRQSNYNRYTLNMTVDNNIGNWGKLGGTVNISHHDESVPDVSAIQNSTEYPTIYPVYTDDGYLGGPETVTGFEDYFNLLGRGENHPLSRLWGRGPNLSQRLDGIGNMFLEVNVTDQIKLRSALNVAYRRSDDLHRRNNEIGLPYEQQARQTSSMDRWLNYTTENLLLFKDTVGLGYIDAVVGYEFTNRKYYGIYGEYRDFDNDLIPYLSGGNTINSLGDEAIESSLVSLFGRINYNYKGKYLLSATYRRDGSSRFGPSKKWGNFPSLSAGWRISDEKFFTSNWINNLYFRASYGFTGNENIGDYRWITSMSLARVAFGDRLTTSYFPSSIENPDLAWERMQQFNFGVNIGLLNDRVMLEADIFRTESDGLLLDVPIPTVSGFSSLFQNIGSIHSKGIELKLTSYNISNRRFSWKMDWTFSQSRSKIQEMGPDGAPIIISRNSMQIINQVGQTPFSFYAYQYDGVYKNQAEIEEHGVTYPFEVHPGDGRYVDVNEDGNINAEDRTVIGDAEPDFIWGINNNFRYKNLDLSFQIGGSVGGQIYNAHRRRSIFFHEGRNYFAAMVDRWRSEDEPGNGYFYKLSVDTDGFERQPSSYWLESGTYLRLRTLSIGYHLPEPLISTLKLANARIYFNGMNLLNFQKGKFIRDPEHSYGDLTDLAVKGVQFGGYPTARTFTLGLNLEF